MAITKKEVLEKATELSLTLTEAEIAQFITDDKLPDEAFKIEKKYLDLIEKAKGDPETVKELVKQLREANQEAGKRRKNAKELQDKLDAIEKKNKEDAEEKLKADGKLQELLDAKEKELNEYKPFKEKFEETDKTIREEYLSKLIPEHRAIAETLPTNAVISYAKLNSIPDPSITHNGNSANGTIVLTDTEKREMKQMGMTDEKLYKEVADYKKGLLTPKPTT